MKGISLAQAANELRIHPSTLRRMIRKGCPTVFLGEVGRGKGSRVDIEQVKSWRGQKAQDTQQQRTDAELLSIVARSLVDVIQEDAAHRRVEIEKVKACGLLALAYQRIWQAVSMQSPDEYYTCQPPEIAQLCAIWLRSIEDR